MELSLWTLREWVSEQEAPGDPHSCNHGPVLSLAVVFVFPSHGLRNMARSLLLLCLTLSSSSLWLGGNWLCPSWLWRGFGSPTFEQRPKCDPEFQEVLLVLVG